MIRPIMLACVVAIVASYGCATTRGAAAAGAVAMLDCEAAHLDEQVLAEAKLFLSNEIQHWLAGAAAPSTAALKEYLAPIKSDLGRCAIAGAVAAALAVTQPKPGVATAALTTGADPAAVRVSVAVAARELGWPQIKLASGEVL